MADLPGGDSALDRSVHRLKHLFVASGAAEAELVETVEDWTNPIKGIENRDGSRMGRRTIISGSRWIPTENRLTAEAAEGEIPLFFRVIHATLFLNVL